MYNNQGNINPNYGTSAQIQNQQQPGYYVNGQPVYANPPAQAPYNPNIYNNYQGTYDQRPISQGPVIGTPVYNIYSQNFGYNQQPVIGGPVLIFANDEMIRKREYETQIKQNGQWFTGCNLMWAIMLVLNIIGRLANIEGENQQIDEPINDTIQISYYFFIAEYTIWFISIIIGIYSLSDFITRLPHLKYYDMGMLLAGILEIVATIILIAGFGKWKSDRKVIAIFLTVLTILCQISFVHSSRVLRQMIINYIDLYLKPASKD